MKKHIVIIIFFGALSLLANAQRAQLILPIGHLGRINFAVFSPDDHYVLTASEDHTAKLWDARTTKLIKTYGCDGDGAIFSNDGKTVWISAEDFVKIWSVRTGQLIDEIPGTFDNSDCTNNGDLLCINSPDEKQGIIYQMSTRRKIRTIQFKGDYIWPRGFSSDGKRLLTTSQTNIIRVFDIATGHNITNLKSQTDYVDHACFSPNGHYIAADSKEGILRLWNGLTYKEMPVLNRDGLSDFLFSPDSKKICVYGSRDYFVYDVFSGRLLKSLEQKKDFIGSVEFSPDSKNILISLGKDVFVRNALTGDLLTTLKLHTGNVKKALYSHDNKRLLTVSEDWTSALWNANTFKNESILKGHSNSIATSFFSPDNAKQVTVESDGKIRMWDTGQGKLDYTLSDSNFFASANFSPDGKKLIGFTERSDTVRIWDAESGATFKKIAYDSQIFPERIKQALISPDNSITVICKADAIDRYSTIQFFDNTYKHIDNDIFVDRGIPVDIKFSKDLKFIVAGYNTKQKTLDWIYKPHEEFVKIIGFNDQKERYQIRDTAGINSFDISPDSKLIAIAYSDGTVKTFNAANGGLIRNLSKESRPAISVNFSPDGRTLVASYHLDKVVLYDSETGSIIRSVKSRYPEKVFFSPDGKYILQPEYEGTITIWDNMLIKIGELKGHTDEITSLHVMGDGVTMFSTSHDGRNICWDLQKLQQQFSRFSVDSTGYIVTDAEGRFDGPDKARKLLYFTCGAEVIGLDQLKSQLWVRNLAQRIRQGDHISSRTLDEMDICGELPIVTANMSSINYEFKIRPQSGGIGDVVLSVNGIEKNRYHIQNLTKSPNGYLLKIKKQELQLFFVAGKRNPISLRAYTKNNELSSDAAVLIQDETGKPPVDPRLFAVMIGVNDYKDDDMALQYAAKDANDLSAVIASSAQRMLNKGGENHVFMYNLTTANERFRYPEKQAIKKTFQDIGTMATANDIILVFFSGHGEISGAKDQYYFLTADASNATASKATADVGISSQELIDWMKPANIKAQKRILILDACYSGQAIKNMFSIGGRQDNFLAAKSIDRAEQAKAIDKLNEQSGFFVITASASDQKAEEAEIYSQGLLTYALLKSIKEQPAILEDNIYLNVSSWFNAAHKILLELSRKLHLKQDPQIVGVGDFNIGVVDPDVIKMIHLGNEKTLYTASVIQNSDEKTMYDDRGITKLVNDRLFKEGKGNTIGYARVSDSPDALTINGRYTLTGNDITVRINITRNGEPFLSDIRVDGVLDKLEELAQKIIEQTILQISKKTGTTHRN